MNQSPIRHLYRQWPATQPMLSLTTITGAVYSVPPGAWLRTDLLTGVANDVRNAFHPRPLKAKYLPMEDGADQDGLPIIMPPEEAPPFLRARDGVAPTPLLNALSAQSVGTRIAMVAFSRAQADDGIRNAHVPFLAVAVYDAPVERDGRGLNEAVRLLLEKPGCDMVAVPAPGASLPVGWLLNLPEDDAAGPIHRACIATSFKRARFPTVGIIVTVHNHLDVALPCLRAVADRTDERHPVIVVDDASDETTGLEVKAACKDLNFHYVGLPKNVGYREAANHGAAFAFADTEVEAVVFLNSDMMVTPGWMEAMIQAMLPTTDGTHAGADLVNLHCNDAALISLPLAGHKIIAPWKRLAGGRSYLDVANALRFLRPEYPPAVTSVGNCMLVTRKAWEAHGPFNEVYGRGYGEECELWAKVVEAGGRAVVADDGYVFHESHAGGMSKNAAEASAAEAAGVKTFIARHGNTYAKHSHIMSEWPQKTARARALVAMAKPTGLPVHFLAVDLGAYGGAYCLMRLVRELAEFGVNASMGHINEQEIALVPPYGPLRHRSEHTLPEDFAKATGATHGVVVASHWSTGVLVRRICDANRGFLPLAFWQDREDLFCDAKGNTHLPTEHAAAYVAIPNRIHNAGWVFQSAVAQLAPPPGAGIKPRTLLPADTDTAHTRCIPVGVDCDLYMPRPRAAGPIRVLAMWRPHTPRRGSARLLEVFNILRREHPGISLEVFGWSAKGESGPPAWVKNHGLLSQRQVAALMGAVNVVLEPSDYQGFGLPGLEAMASGAVLVSTDTMGVHAYATRGNAVIVGHDAREMADAVVTLAGNDHQRRLIGASARARALDFDWQLIAARWVIYLRDLWAAKGTDAAFMPGLERAATHARAILDEGREDALDPVGDWD